MKPHPKETDSSTERAGTRTPELLFLFENKNKTDKRRTNK